MNIFRRMSSLESHTVISQVLQAERALLLDVMSVISQVALKLLQLPQGTTRCLSNTWENTILQCKEEQGI